MKRGVVWLSAVLLSLPCLAATKGAATRTVPKAAETAADRVTSVEVPAARGRAAAPAKPAKSPRPTEGKDGKRRR